MKEEIQKLQFEIEKIFCSSCGAPRKTAVDESIEIIVWAMNENYAERETNKFWYLGQLKLQRIFNRFCNEKYFPGEIYE